VTAGGYNARVTRWLRWLFRPPSAATDPHETLRWVRSWEIVSGIAAIAFGLALWNGGWWHWLLIGVGLVGVAPWPGAQAILRRAERKPEILISDPDRRAARARRVVAIQAPILVAAGALLGYVVDGWAAAITMGAFMGVSAALGAWWVLRGMKT
jgi:hypothetical protein